MGRPGQYRTPSDKYDEAVDRIDYLNKRMRSLETQRTLFIVALLVVGALAATWRGYMNSAHSDAERFRRQADSVDEAYKTQLWVGDFILRKELLEAAVAVEAATRLSGEKMAADSYEIGYRNGLQCGGQSSEQECLVDLAEASIPTYPSDFGAIPDSVESTTEARTALRHLERAICDFRPQHLSVNHAADIPPLELESIWGERVKWLMKQGCKAYGSAVGGVLLEQAWVHQTFGTTCPCRQVRSSETFLPGSTTRVSRVASVMQATFGNVLALGAHCGAVSGSHWTTGTPGARAARRACGLAHDRSLIAHQPRSIGFGARRRLGRRPEARS